MIEIKNVSFKYDEESEDFDLKNINLKIKKGEVVLLCGESGCGKSTLTRLINGLVPQFFKGTFLGQVLINGKEINSMPLHETAKIVGSVFQNPRSQFFNVKTTSELAFGCENQGIDKEEILNRIEKVVNRMKMNQLLDRSIFELSGGEKQKIACASISVSDPEIIVLDEPTSNLDVESIESLKNMISIWKNQGKTVIISEHRLYFLNDLADKVIYMKKGEIKYNLPFDKFFTLKKNHMMDMGLRTLSYKELVFNEKNNLKAQEQMIIKDLKLSYDKKKNVVDIENLVLPMGEIIAVIGKNGAGKSSFAKCLCGLEKKSKVSIEIGKSVYKSRNIIKNAFMVMQDVNHQLFTESVLDEVLLSMDVKDENKAKQSIKWMDLNGFEERHPMSLSGGQKQRAVIASSIVTDKKILIFDEPTSGLDLKHMYQVSENLRRLQNSDKSIFVITHDIEFIAHCCTYILHVESGKIKNHYKLDNKNKDEVCTFFNLN